MSPQELRIKRCAAKHHRIVWDTQDNHNLCMCKISDRHLGNIIGLLKRTRLSANLEQQIEDPAEDLNGKPITNVWEYHRRMERQERACATLIERFEKEQSQRQKEAELCAKTSPPKPRESLLPQLTKTKS